MAVGTLVITHLTPQDLRAEEILLPKNAVEANILPALTYPLLKFKVIPPSTFAPMILLLLPWAAWYNTWLLCYFGTERCNVFLLLL